MKKNRSFARFVVGCAAFAFTVASTGMVGVISTPRTAEASTAVVDLMKLINIRSANQSSTAVGSDAIAMGAAAYANGESAISLGHGSAATNKYALAVGTAGAYGEYATALGAFSNASANNSVALGAKALVGADAAQSLALGYNSKVYVGVTNAVAIGSDSIAEESGTISVGNAETEYYRRIVNVEYAEDAHDAVALGQLQNGSTWINVANAQVGGITINGANNNITGVGTLAAHTVEADAVVADDAYVANSVKVGGVTIDGRNNNIAGVGTLAADAVVAGNVTAAGTVQAGAVVTNNFQAGDVKIDGGNNTIKVGDIKIDGSTNKITGMADGTTANDAVTYAQMWTQLVSLKATGNFADATGTIALRGLAVGNIKFDERTNKITGVADGGVYKGSTEVVNGGQLYNVDKNVGYAGALAAALTALHPVPYDELRRTTFSAGFGNYRGEQGYAVGVFHYLGEDVLANAAMSYNSGGDVMSRVGISFAIGEGGERKTVTKTAYNAMEKKLAEQETVISELQNEKTKQDTKLAAQDEKIAQLMKTVELLSSRLSEVEKKK